MSASQRQDKPKNKLKAQPKPESEEPKVDEAKVEEFKAPEPKVEEQPKPEPKAEPAPPKYEVDAEKLVKWAARLRTGFGHWMNGANFGNHMIKDSVKVDGKELSIPEASQLISKLGF